MEDNRRKSVLQTARNIMDMDKDIMAAKSQQASFKMNMNASSFPEDEEEPQEGQPTCAPPGGGPTNGCRCRL